MKSFKSLGLGIAIALSSFTGYGQGLITRTFTIPLNVSTTNLIDGAAKINQIVVSVGSTVGAGSWTYYAIDGPQTNAAFGTAPIRYAYSAYASIGQYLTNISKITTQYSGWMTTNTFTNALYTYTNTVAASSNLYNTTISGTISTNSTVTTPLGSPLYHVFGLTWSNTPPATGMTVTVTYDPSL